ncbi:unnamed protein product [Symbiodinium sp. CCMP2592]|nr:unnamed protein product [Symbiodinium sp. CCMP2592]
MTPCSWQGERQPREGEDPRHSRGTVLQALPEVLGEEVSESTEPSRLLAHHRPEQDFIRDEVFQHQRCGQGRLRLSRKVQLRATRWTAAAKKKKRLGRMETQSVNCVVFCELSSTTTSQKTDSSSLAAVVVVVVLVVSISGGPVVVVAVAVPVEVTVVVGGEEGREQDQEPICH